MCLHLIHMVCPCRSEDHRWCFDPVGKEAVRRDDPDGFLLERVCSDWLAAVYGKFEAEVCEGATVEQHTEFH